MESRARHFGLTNALLLNRFSCFREDFRIFFALFFDLRKREGHQLGRRFRFERDDRKAGEEERSGAVGEWKTINSVEQSGKLRSNKFFTVEKVETSSKFGGERGEKKKKERKVVVYLTGFFFFLVEKFRELCPYINPNENSKSSLPPLHILTSRGKLVDAFPLFQEFSFRKGKTRRAAPFTSR